MTQQINRRTVTKGIAWSVPAVALASAAPAFAASPGDIYGPTITIGCKLPGASCSSRTGFQFGYTFTITLCNKDTEDVVVTFRPSTIYVAGASQTVPIYTGVNRGNPVTTATIPAEDCRTFYIYVDAGDSANAAITGEITFTYPGNFGETHTGTVNVNIPATPPCNDCVPEVAPGTPVNDGGETTAVVTEEAAVADTAPAAEEAPAPVTTDAAPVEAAPQEETAAEVDVEEPVVETEVVEEETN